MLERKLFSKNAKIKVQNDHGTIIRTLKVSWNNSGTGCSKQNKNSKYRS